MLTVSGLSRFLTSEVEFVASLATTSREFFKWVSEAIKCLFKVYSLVNLQHCMTVLEGKLYFVCGKYEIRQGQLAKAKLFFFSFTYMFSKA